MLNCSRIPSSVPPPLRLFAPGTLFNIIATEMPSFCASNRHIIRVEEPPPLTLPLLLSYSTPINHLVL